MLNSNKRNNRDQHEQLLVAVQKYDDLALRLDQFYARVAARAESYSRETELILQQQLDALEPSVQQWERRQQGRFR
jgi:hypothetical protein